MRQVLSRGRKGKEQVLVVVVVVVLSRRRKGEEQVLVVVVVVVLSRRRKGEELVLVLVVVGGLVAVVEVLSLPLIHI